MACNGGNAFSEYTLAKATSCTPVAKATAEIVAVTLSGLTAIAALEVSWLDGSGVLLRYRERRRVLGTQRDRYASAVNARLFYQAVTNSVRPSSSQEDNLADPQVKNRLG